jgi:PncC family amidohydrolase
MRSVGGHILLLSEDPHLLCSRLRAFGKTLRGARLETRVDFPEVRVAVMPAGDGPARGGAVSSAERAIARRFARAVVPGDGRSLPESFVAVLRRKRLTFACAESCTGGAIAGLVTGVPGSSDVFLAGVVSYADEAKAALLGVDRRLLARRGAVSGAVVAAMLDGILAATGAGCAAATSGIAGPTGGTREKPVGLVYYGAACGRKRVVRRTWLAGLERGAMQRLTAHLALKLVLEITL